jgi:hypothetical protein
MSKLGIRFGWTPPPSFEFSDGFPDRLEKETALSFSPSGVRELEAACYRLMLARRKRVFEAEAVRTRDILQGWTKAYAQLHDVLKDSLPGSHCPRDGSRAEGPEIVAAWMAVARCSDSQTAKKLPQDLNGHVATIEAMRYLTERAHREVAESISFGPEGNAPVRFWIDDIADVFESEGFALRTETRRGPRTSSKFITVLGLLREEMSPAKFERVRLPAKNQLVDLTREVLSSRLDASGPEKSR